MPRDGKIPPPNVMTMSKENPLGGPGGGPPMPMNAGPPMHMPPHPDAAQGPGGWGKFQDSYLTFLNASPGTWDFFFAYFIRVFVLRTIGYAVKVFEFLRKMKIFPCVELPLILRILVFFLFILQNQAFYLRSIF